MTPLFNPTQMVAEAMERIRPHIRQTILDPSTYYSQRTGADVHFKCGIQALSRREAL
jgi:threonine dehydratase